MVLGYALIAFGLGFLLRATDILSAEFWGVIWPLMLIAFGLILTTKRYSNISILGR